MFAAESEMARPVSNWLQAAGLQVKTEFITPLGVCDVVGLSFRQSAVEIRLRRRQTHALRSVSQVAVLELVPTVSSGNAISIKRLQRELADAHSIDTIREDVDDLIARRFLVGRGRTLVQKVSRWRPLHERILAVELKLSRVAEALRQARNNLDFATESYVAFPTRVANEIASKSHAWTDFFSLGVGLLAVGSRTCRTLIQPRASVPLANSTIQAFAAEKFWRTRATGSKTAKH